MNLRQERLLSRRSQLGRERFKCWNAWCSWHRQRHERGRYRCVALSLFTDPAVHHVRVQAMRQGHTTDAGPRLGTQGKYLCLELLAVFTPAWAVLIQRLFHRLHDPPSWGRCPLHAGSSRWDRRALTAAQPLAMFEYQPTRAGAHALKFLTAPNGKFFNGYLQVDGYAGYNTIQAAARVGCMAHVRRKFVEVQQSIPAVNDVAPVFWSS